MAVNKRDYYEILGVSKNASDNEIKKAYRKLAQQHHPDKGGGDDTKFKEANEAYQVLSDSQKRAQYDQFGHAFNQGSEGQGFGGFDFSGQGGSGAGFDFSEMFNGGGFSDIFDSFFTGGAGRQRGPQRGSDLQVAIEITLKEAAFGVEKTIDVFKKDICDECKGTGAAKGTKIIKCSKCGGSGQVQTTRRTILGQISQVTVCPKCQGSGEYPEKVCSNCGGDGRVRKSKKIKIKIPAGVDNGSTIRLSGEGEAAPKGGIPGDLFINIVIKPDNQFIREGDNLIKQEEISFADAALGTVLRLETLDGKIDLKISAGIQSGKVFKIPNKGIKHLQGQGYGDMFVKVKVITPTGLNGSQKELFQKLKEEEKSGGFWHF